MLEKFVVGPSPVVMGQEGESDVGIVSPQGYIRPLSGDLCDKCKSSNEACSLRTEAHEAEVRIINCSHFGVGA